MKRPVLLSPFMFTLLKRLGVFDKHKRVEPSCLSWGTRPWKKMAVSELKRQLSICRSSARAQKLRARIQTHEMELDLNETQQL